MREEFASRLFPILKTPYQAIAQMAQMQIDNAWRNEFQRQHSIQLNSSGENAEANE